MQQQVSNQKLGTPTKLRTGGGSHPTPHMLAQLDKEHFQRIHEVTQSWGNGKGINDVDIISNKEVRQALNQPKLWLPKFQIGEIFSNYALSQRLFIHLCPGCLKPSEIDLASEVLGASDVVPVLMGNYADYSPALMSSIIHKPHMNRYEFRLYRSVRVLDQCEKAVCGHCVDKQKASMLKTLESYDHGTILKRVIERTLQNLHPFIHPDFELIDLLNATVEKKDFDACFALEGASASIRSLRTCQALGSRCMLKTGDVPELLKDAHLFVKDESAESVSKLTDGLMESFSLQLNPSLRPNEFFELASLYRDELASIVDHLISEARPNSDDKLSFSKLTNRLGELNAEVSKLKSNTRFLAYRAAFGFLKSNRALVGTALVAGTLGLAGSLVGCSAAIVTGVASKVLRVKGKLKATPETRAFLDGVKKSIRPKFHKLLASYTGISLPAVQLFEITQDAREKVKNKTAFRKKRLDS